MRPLNTMSLQDTIPVPPVAEAVRRAQAGGGYWARVRQRLLADPVTLTAMALLACIIVMALAAPLLATHDPLAGSVLSRLKSPGYRGHWLGTDEVGRDLWSRILYGGRLSLLCGVAPVGIALIIGGGLGLLAGYCGGIANSLIMRCMDVLYAFPSILLAIAICGMLGSGVGNTILALTITFIPPIVRMSETVTTQARSYEFVEAARASGAGPLSIIRFHILNNVLGPILVYATSLISISIILAAGLSFLGLGVTPPNAEWGLMLNNLRQAIWVNPLVAALPGAMIFATSMCFNLMSDGLRTAMDVRMAER
jgi:peptide/nickel transport system permease protein